MGCRGVWLAAPWEPLESSLSPFHPHRWFCHVDDDNYLNPKALLKLLKAFPRTRDVYVGRPSLNRPIHASEPQPRNRTVGASPAASFMHWLLVQGGGAYRGRGL